MVICVVALFVFSFLGIFSIRWRRLAKEAFICVSKTIIFQPCTTKLDERIRSRLTAKLMKIPTLARFVYKNFILLSWIFVIIFFGSLAVSGRGLYYLATQGTCDPHATNCPFAITAPLCGCEGICQCEKEICLSPEYLACKGNCSCQKEVCGIAG